MMSDAIAKPTWTVALIGNPNTGKSTLFSALVGIHQHVGNYPGVTVEKKTGRMEHDGRTYEIIDLPGLYSLAARSRDEMVAVEVLLGCEADVGAADAVICLVDASNLQRHCYLMGQVLEMERPTVVAVNMLDMAAGRGIRVDLEAFQRRLGVPVVGIQANRGVGIESLKAALAEAIEHGPRLAPTVFPEAFEQEVGRLESLFSPEGCCSQCVRTCRECSVAISLTTKGTVPSSRPDSGWCPRKSDQSPPPLPRCLVRRLLLDVNGLFQTTLLPTADGQLTAALSGARDRLLRAGCEVPGIETTARYDWTRQLLRDVVEEPGRFGLTATDRIDRWLTHRVWGTLVFALVMLMVFQSVFVGAKPAMKGIEALTGAAGHWVETLMPEGAVRSLLVDGVIGGAGAVLAFLPQILVLFAFIAVLEDCGYMARAAYLMDRLMARAGLSGRSFIPMLSSFACAVPGIMAARVIENERDRLTTILVAPLLTCSARLPVYALLIAAFLPETTYLGDWLSLQGLTLAALYALGIVAAVTVATVLKKTILRGPTPPFLMELPSYKWPSPRTVVFRVIERAWVFLRTAGTLILAVSMVVWAAAYYPHDPRSVEPLTWQQEALQAESQRLRPKDPRQEQIARQLEHLDHQVAAAYQEHSILGRLGHAIEPAVRPLGWDWRIGCAVLASLPAREIVVATLGVVYGQGKEVDAKSSESLGQLQTRLQNATWEGTDRPVFSIPVALSLMVFYALCAQCAATLAVIRRETNSWRWPIFTFTYMTMLAYAGAFVTYQLGTWLGQGGVLP